jgi:hypothetical protein
MPELAKPELAKPNLSWLEYAGLKICFISSTTQLRPGFAVQKKPKKNWAKFLSWCNRLIIILNLL